MLDASPPSPESRPVFPVRASYRGSVQRGSIPRRDRIVARLSRSTIVVHSLTKLRRVYINIFSCKDFDTDMARDFTINWFEANMYNDTVVIRR